MRACINLSLQKQLHGVTSYSLFLPVMSIDTNFITFVNGKCVPRIQWYDYLYVLQKTNTGSNSFFTSTFINQVVKTYFPTSKVL